MLRKLVNRICLVLSILSVVGSAILAVMAIWDVVYNSELLSRAFWTFAVIFSASVITLFLTRDFSQAKGEPRINA